MLYMIYTNTQDIFFDICNKKGSTHRPKLEYYAKPISNRLYLAISLHKFNEDEKLNEYLKNRVVAITPEEILFLSKQLNSLLNG